MSSSGDGIIIYSDLERPDTSMTNKFTCHKRTAYEIMTIPNDPNTFLSCGEDKTVRWFDIRTKTSCDVENCTEVIIFHNSVFFINQYYLLFTIFYSVLYFFIIQ